MNLTNHFVFVHDAPMTKPDAQGAPSTETPAQGGTGASTTENVQGAGTVPQADFDRLQASFAELSGKLESVLGDNKKYRDERSQSREANNKALHEQGEFKQLAEARAAEIEALRAEVSTLGGLKSDAEAFRNHREKEAKRIGDVAAGLPDDQRAILDAIPDVFDRASALAVFQNVAGKPAPNAPPIPVGSSAPSHGAPFEGLTGDALVQAIRDDPQGWRDTVSANGAQKGTMFQRFFKKPEA